MKQRIYPERKSWWRFIPNGQIYMVIGVTNTGLNDAFEYEPITVVFVNITTGKGELESCHIDVWNTCFTKLEKKGKMKSNVSKL